MKVLMACAGGMSSSFVADALKKEAQKQGIEFSIMAVADSRIKEYIGKDAYDLVILAPQIKFRYKDVCNSLEGTNIKVLPIEGTLYTPMGASKLLQQMVDKVNG